MWWQKDSFFFQPNCIPKQRYQLKLITTCPPHPHQHSAPSFLKTTLIILNTTTTKWHAILHFTFVITSETGHLLFPFLWTTPYPFTSYGYCGSHEKCPQASYYSRSPWLSTLSNGALGNPWPHHWWAASCQQLSVACTGDTEADTLLGKTELLCYLNLTPLCLSDPPLD